MTQCTEMVGKDTSQSLKEKKWQANDSALVWGINGKGQRGCKPMKKTNQETIRLSSTDSAVHFPYDFTSILESSPSQQILAKGN